MRHAVVFSLFSSLHLCFYPDHKFLFVNRNPVSSRCSALAVPANYKLVAVAFLDLYENAARYGPVIASIPQAMSRYQMMYM